MLELQPVKVQLVDRKAGQVPATIYRNGDEATLIQLTLERFSSDLNEQTIQTHSLTSYMVTNQKYVW